MQDDSYWQNFLYYLHRVWLLGQTETFVWRTEEVTYSTGSIALYSDCWSLLTSAEAF